MAGEKGQQHTRSVEAHYTGSNLTDSLFRALRAAGKDLTRLTREDLAPYDELHIGGREATRALARLAGLQPGMAVLDVGAGIGGPARTLAAEFGCRVTGLELVGEFCRAARALTEAVGLSALVSFEEGDAQQMPFPDHSFNAVWMQQMTVNVPDKAMLFREAGRLLRPGGLLALFEVCAGRGGQPHYPVPWADSPAISFLEPPDAMRRLLEAEGFRIAAWEDATAVTHRLLQEHEASPDEKTANVARNLAEERILLVQVVARRPGVSATAGAAGPRPPRRAAPPASSFPGRERRGEA
jgi:MPBQ/MSBQ methyltransferase